MIQTYLLKRFYRLSSTGILLIGMLTGFLVSSAVGTFYYRLLSNGRFALENNLNFKMEMTINFDALLIFICWSLWSGLIIGGINCLLLKRFFFVFKYEKSQKRI